MVVEGMHTNFHGEMSYSDYLGLDTLFSAQNPLSPEHDELLFIVIHQTQELWLKLFNHELDVAIANIRMDQLQPAFKCLARVGRIQEQLRISKALFRREEEYEMDLWVVKYASRRSRIGDFSGDSSVRGARIRGVLASQASAGQRGLSAQGVEPDGRGFAAGIRCYVGPLRVPFGALTKPTHREESEDESSDPLQSNDNAAEGVLYMAMELGDKRWKLVFNDGGAKRRHETVEAGRRMQLVEAISKAKAKFHLSPEARVVSCYEAGRDASGCTATW